MKTVLCAVASSFVHKNLAVQKLGKFLGDAVTIREFTVNQPLNTVYAALLSEKADVYAFSCYIWNVEFEKKLAEMLKAALSATIVFGGPEAGAEPEEFLRKTPFCDFVIRGEGEAALSHLLSCLSEGETPSMAGIYGKHGGFGLSPRVQRLPRPYDEEDLADAPHRLIYYEASRGCYNGCAYCVSSLEAEACYDEETVKEDIRFFVRHGVPLVKFVDRSFNACRERAERLFSFLASETGDTRFHLEVAPDLFTESMLQTIENAPSGKFQFEAGLQSLNEETLKAIGRRHDNEKALACLRRLSVMPACELHVDLIAALPLEDKESFERSFNGVYALGACQMDVGVLKVLPGTPMRRLSARYGLVYESFAPYEVIKTDKLSAFELQDIRSAAHALERLYNSGLFSHTLSRLSTTFESAYRMYETLGAFLPPAISLSEVFSRLLSHFPAAKDALVRDFLLSGEKKPPENFNMCLLPHFPERCMAFIARYIGRYFPELSALHPGQAYKQLKFFAFDTGIYMAKRSGSVVYNIEKEGWL